MRRWGSYMAIFVLTWTGCVDKVDLSLPASELPIIVDGMVTDQPGPDTVRLTQAYPADGQTHPRTGISGAKMAIADDVGTVDSLIELGNGVYITNALNGVVGRTYQLSILLPDTNQINPVPTRVVSTPQRLLPAGSVDEVFYELTTRINISTGLSENGFNIFINSTLGPGSSRRMLWRFFGTFTVTTDPSAITIEIPCADPPCQQIPLPCSEDCECCTCWYTTFERAPIVSAPNVLGGSQLNRVFIQYIPINSRTFFERYRVEVSQMELSEEVFEFYQAIRNQADNASNIFQPPFFELEGNLTVQSGSLQVTGTFAASAVARRHIYIPRSAVPYKLSSELEPADCRAIEKNATNTMPPYWE
jgi:Domain of unknown function (DUF4249)